MSKQIIYFFFSLTLMCAIVFSSSNALTNSNGAPQGHSGSIGDGQSTCSSCHNVNVLGFSPSYSLTINSSIEEYYIPGSTFYFTVSVMGAGIDEFGFQACFENDEGDKIGEIILVDPSQTQLLSGGDFITHTASGTTGLGAKTWGFYWMVPTSLEGNATLFVSALLSNNNGQNTGDKVMSTSEIYTQATIGCTDVLALNYNALATSDDESCFYSLSSFSPLSISYDSLTILGDVFDSELEIGLNVHNNSDSDLVVYAMRNIISSDVPTNWFCWNVCYLPTTNISPLSVTVGSGSYTSEFSAHLAPFAYGGVYDIEYCFYSESDYSDSICTIVHYVVEGDIPGCTDVNAINYNSTSTVDDGTCILYPQPNWIFSSLEEGVSHSVVITLDSEIEINDQVIAIGDWIGVFHESIDGLVCVGFTEWQAENTNISIMGFSESLGEGFMSGEEFIWQVWDASEGVSWPMDVSYSSNFPDEGYFVEDGQSAVVSMYNLNPITHQDLDFPNGWSLFSSYMITADMNIMTVLEPIVDDLIIVKDNNGNAYLVEYQFNALGSIQPGQGYLIKTNAALQLTLEGAFAKPELHPVQLFEGWNMIGYLREDAELAENIFEDLVDQDIIQIVKDYMGNAYIPQWYFNGIGEMEPGKGYQVKTFQDAELQY